LVIDETTAHIDAPPGLSAALFEWFREHAIACSLVPQQGCGGSDVLNFGNPSAAEERRIRTLLGEWERQRTERSVRGTS
jgi:hypothetical protein